VLSLRRSVIYNHVPVAHQAKGDLPATNQNAGPANAKATKYFYCLPRLPLTRSGTAIRLLDSLAHSVCEGLCNFYAYISVTTNLIHFYHSVWTCTTHRAFHGSTNGPIYC